MLRLLFSLFISSGVMDKFVIFLYNDGQNMMWVGFFWGAEGGEGQGTEPRSHLAQFISYNNKYKVNNVCEDS